MIGPLILQQQPAPATAHFDFACFMRESGENTTTLLSAIRKADAHHPPGPILVYSEHAGGGARLTGLMSVFTASSDQIR